MIENFLLKIHFLQGLDIASIFLSCDYSYTPKLEQGKCHVEGKRLRYEVFLFWISPWSEKNTKNYSLCQQTMRLFQIWKPAKQKNLGFGPVLNCVPQK